MGNSSPKISTTAKAIQEQETEKASLSQNMRRRGIHTTSLQLILKDRLAQWDNVTIEMISTEFYDPELQKTIGGKANNSDMKPMWGKIKRSLKIHRWKSIKSFRLRVLGRQAISDPGLLDLVRGVSQDLPELDNLNLDSAASDISDHGLDSLGLLISRKFRALKSLRIRVSYEETGLKSMISDVSRHLYDIGDLYIDFPEQTRENNVKTIISTAFKHLVKLTVLDLDFSYCKNISVLGFSEIGSELIRYKRNLLSLTLQFCSMSKFLNQGIEFLESKVCQGFQNLKDLTLDFQQSHLNDDTFQSMLLDIPCYLRKLERLQLDFRGCKRIANECVKFLAGNVIPSLLNLQELKLSFENKNISDSAIQALISINYNKLVHLKKIDFNLYTCPNITNKGIQALMVFLKKNLGNFTFFRIHLLPNPAIKQEIDILKDEFRSSPNFELRDTDGVIYHAVI